MTDTAYIAGPMTNLPNFNFPAFDAVAAEARKRGFEVSNPHEHDQELYPTIDEAEATKTGDVQALAAEIGFSFAGAMTWDLSEVLRVSHLILLPGWEKSTGARFERAVAEACGKTILLAKPEADEAGIENGWWTFDSDEDQQRITTFLRTFGAWHFEAPDITNWSTTDMLTEIARRFPNQGVIQEGVRHIQSQFA